MPFDIDNLNPGCWFDSPFGDGERVRFRVPDAAALREIDRQTLERRVEYIQPRKANGKPDRRAALQRIEYDEVIDAGLREQLMTDHCIVDWEIKRPDGTPIPCTTENKMRLMQGSIDFGRWMTECLERISEDTEQGARAATKN